MQKFCVGKHGRYVNEKSFRMIKKLNFVLESAIVQAECYKKVKIDKSDKREGKEEANFFDILRIFKPGSKILKNSKVYKLKNPIQPWWIFEQRTRKFGGLSYDVEAKTEFQKRN